MRRRDLLISEDMGYVDDSGLFYVIGRVGEVVNLRGEWISLQRLESLIVGLESIDEACLSIAPTSNESVGLFATITTPRGSTSNQSWDVADEMREVLPAGIELTGVKITDVIPKTPSGKVIRRAPEVTGS